MRLPAPLALAAALTLIGLPQAHAERPTEIDDSRSGSVTLQYTFDRGAAHNFVLDWTYASEELEGGDGGQTSVTLNMPLTHEVQTTAGGAGTIATSLQTPTLVREIDGEPAETSGLSGALLSARLTSTVARDGTVSNASGTVTTTDPDEATAIGFLNDVFQLQWIQFPLEAISIGDSWLQTQQDLEGGLTSVLSARYTLVGFTRSGERDLAVIDTVYTYSVDGQVVAERSGRPARIVARGHGEGYVLFDHNRGQVHEMGIRLGTILTSTETSGVHRSSSFSHEGTLRAQVVEIVVPD